ncbi:MAG: pyrroline-5-carboxylate reductase [Candidatus Omnitrophica bacterium]|nr:pyrroline-5-carboxylate reductase [Candidatus Omnitrophota bacterium]
MKTIGIIGFGNMGSAIAKRLNIPLCVFDVDTLKTSNLRDTIRVVLSAALVVQESDIIILAVKPQDFVSLLDSIRKPAEGKDKLFISIAAGITTGYLERALGNVRVIRTMPNTPVEIGEGMIALSKGAYATDSDLQFTEKEIFGCLGKTLVVKENMLNAVTAVSGSGPAYVCYFLEKESINPATEKKNKFLNEFIEAAQGVGFSFEQATLLVKQTYEGTIRFLNEMNVAPSQLRERVTSRGGTTEAALVVLHNGGSLEEAVRAAFRRAQELSKKE